MYSLSGLPVVERGVEAMARQVGSYREVAAALRSGERRRVAQRVARQSGTLDHDHGGRELQRRGGYTHGLGRLHEGREQVRVRVRVSVRVRVRVRVRVTLGSRSLPVRGV